MLYYRNAATAETFTPRSASQDDRGLRSTLLYMTALASCMVVAKIWTTTMWVLLFYQFDPDDNHFSLHLCITELQTLQNDGLHRVIFICLLEYQVIEYRLPIYDFPIMNPDL